MEEKENYTLDELKQKLINNLYKKDDLSYSSNEIDLLKFILMIEKD